MTVSNDALGISSAILISVCVPVTLRAWLIILLALQDGYVTESNLDLASLMVLIGLGGIIFGILIYLAGTSIDGGFAE